MTEFSADLAVIIGISAYPDAVGRLTTPVDDAEAVAGVLRDRFGYEVILLRDGEATLAGLRDLLKDLPNRVPPDSRLLFYFAGHGVAQDSAELEGPRGFLVPYDGSANVETHLPMHEVYEALAALPCRHLLVSLDCCFSGSFRWADRRPLVVPAAMLYEERYRHWVRHPARWVLASAAHDEYALDIADRRRGQAGSHSPFAAAVLDGLAGEADRFPEGGDGVITLAELYAYVQDRLSPHQSPLLAPLPGQVRGEYVFRDPRQSQTLPSAEELVRLDAAANPYRGLEAYRREDAELFFGRGDATSHLLDHVGSHPLTVVAGPSGSGKSSLVQAGLLPALHQGQSSPPDVVWTVPPPLRVSGDPFSALYDALAVSGGPPPPSGADLRNDASSATAWLAVWLAKHPRHRLLIVIDQAEELVTRVARGGWEETGALPATSAGLLGCLASLLTAGEGSLSVLIVVRSDYEPDLEDGPLAPWWNAGRFLVPPMIREELRQVVEGPAAGKALYFDDPRLVDRLVDEVLGMPGGLPLLSYALSRLYLAYLDSGRGDRLLTAADIAKIGGEAPAEGASGPVAPGGIVRVLRKAADDLARELPDEAHRRTLWRVLLRMVNLAGGRLARRQVPLSELDYPDWFENRRVAEVLQELLDARLLVRDRNAEEGRAGEQAVVEPAHDELLVAWPELARRIDDARLRLPVHRRFAEAAAAWASGPRARRDLDLRLLGLVEESRLPEDWLNRAEADYLEAARAERRRRTRQRWGLTAAALLLTTGAAVFFLQQSRSNERLRYQSLVQSLVNQAASDVGAGQRIRGLLLARQALNFLPRSEGTLGASIDRVFRQVLDDTPPGEKDLDQALRRWGLPQDSEGWVRGIGRERLLLNGVPTLFAAAPGDHSPLAVGYATGDVVLYDPETGYATRCRRPDTGGLLGVDPGRLVSESTSVTALVWSQDGQSLHVFDDAGLWRTHDRNGTLLQSQWIGARVCAAAGSADGKWLAIDTAAAGAESLEVRPAEGGEPVPVDSWINAYDICRIGFSFHPNRTLLAVGKGTDVKLWEPPARAGRWRSRKLAEVEGRVHTLAWAGDLLALGGPDGDGGFVEVLDLDGGLRRSWKTRETPIDRVAFEPAGERLAASSSNGELRVWSLGSPDALPVVLSELASVSGRSTDFPAFLGPGRIAALTSGGLSVWKLGTRALADAFCVMAPANLTSRDWTSYVDQDLTRYELACPDRRHGPDPSVLHEADLLAGSGEEVRAVRIYERLNDLKAGTVVSPPRRAQAVRIEDQLSRFDAVDLADVQYAMTRAQRYEVLRRAEGLLPLPQKVPLQLCRRGALLGEAQRALPLCEEALTLLKGDGIARDSRGLALALLGDLAGAREDFIASRDWLEDPAWRQQRQVWIDALSEGRNPITPQVRAAIARDELGEKAAQEVERITGLRPVQLAGIW